MPQELQVVRCYICEMFQVDIVKKVQKWTCKVCGEQQSVKEIYGKGNGKDCRSLVQNLNQQRMILEENNVVAGNEECLENKTEIDYQATIPQTSKCMEFLPEPTKVIENDTKYNLILEMAKDHNYSLYYNNQIKLELFQGISSNESSKHMNERKILEKSNLFEVKFIPNVFREELNKCYNKLADNKSETVSKQSTYDEQSDADEKVLQKNCDEKETTSEVSSNIFNDDDDLDSLLQL